MNIDKEQVQYTIVNFDEPNQVVTVEFLGENRVAHIALTPFPTTEQELDELIRPFGTHREMIDVVPELLDFDVVRKHVGKLRVTKRYGRSAEEIPMGKDLPATELDLDRAYLRSLVEEILVEREAKGQAAKK